MRNPLFRQTGQAAAGRNRAPTGVSGPVKEPRVICHRAGEEGGGGGGGGGGGAGQAAIESSRRVSDH